MATAPIINLNGTSADALLNQYERAAHALLDAIRVLHAAAPHGRDFQTAAPFTYERARIEHEHRIHCLNSILTEVAEVRNAIAEQKAQREGTR